MLSETIRTISDNILLAAIEITQKEYQVNGHGVQKNLNVPFTNMEQKDWALAIGLWLKYGKKLLDSLPKRNCPACESGHNRKLFESYDGYDFHECLNCGCWFVPKVVYDEFFEKFFSMCPKAKILHEKMTEKRLNTLEFDIQRISSNFEGLRPFVEAGSGNLSYLDVGCGLGHSLIVARQLGYIPVGLDVDSKAISLGKEKDLNIYHINDSIPVKTYGLISFWETLEHISNPVEELKKYTSFLDRGGIISLTVPNLDSPVVRMLRGDCSYVFGGYNCPGHINLFNINSIKELLERSGLSLLYACTYFSNNLFELLYYMVGKNKGAYNYINDLDIENKPEPVTDCVINILGPSISVLDRMSMTAPILKIIACKKNDEYLFDDALNNYNDTTLKSLLETAQTIMTGNDIKTTNEKISVLNNELHFFQDRYIYPLIRKLCIYEIKFFEVYSSLKVRLKKLF